MHKTSTYLFRVVQNNAGRTIGILFGGADILLTKDFEKLRKLKFSTFFFWPGKQIFFSGGPPNYLASSLGLNKFEIALFLNY